MRLCDFPILTFDTYGTLIDWETGIWDALQPLCARLADPPTHEAALTAFAQVESACQAANPDSALRRPLGCYSSHTSSELGQRTRRVCEHPLRPVGRGLAGFCRRGRIARLFEAPPPADNPH